MSPSRKIALGACGALLLLVLGLSPLGLKLWREYQWRQCHARHWGRISARFMDRAESSEAGSRAAFPEPLRALYDPLEQALEAELQARAALLRQADESRQLVAACLHAIETRDAPALELLGPEIVRSKHELALARKDWLAQAGELSASIEALRAAWRLEWPQNQLSFLLTAPQRSRPAKQDEAARLGLKLRAAWRDTQELRLARLLSGGAEADFPAPLPPVAGALAASADAYAAALKLRGELRVVFEENLRALEQDAQVDLSKVKLADVQPPLRPPYLADKVNATLARLRLLSILDGMLETCRETTAREASRQWQNEWPGRELPDAPELLSSGGP